MLALKSKIRSYRVQLDDPWSMQTSMGAKNKSGEPVEVSFSAPHIAKNEEKIKVGDLAKTRASVETSRKLEEEISRKTQVELS